MPAYDFRCPDCGDVFEIVRAASEAGDVCCPQCGTVAKRVFSPVGVVLKGSGFHNTDYRPKPKDDAPACPTSGSKDACASCPAAKE